MRATTGAAPVPVPPPIPAVINTMSVSSSKKLFNFVSRSFGVFFSAFGDGHLLHDPDQSQCEFGIEDCSKACLSVLMSTKRYVLNTFVKHVVYGVVTTTANANNFYAFEPGCCQNSSKVVN